MTIHAPLLSRLQLPSEFSCGMNRRIVGEPAACSMVWPTSPDAMACSPVPVAPIWGGDLGLHQLRDHQRHALTD
jgi:hypothetical protein